MTLTEATRQYIRQRAKYLCEYCHSPEEISTSRFTIDHIKPRSLYSYCERNCSSRIRLC
ncbi:MAG: HNH endonuclease [Microcoleus sp. PH2017_22_RUC_O_B]|uniref:HNH endonuclease n=1 Tax=unclassified Microcoleus TaxID=2642155 RepID=UPI001DDF838E|nr:MULTISPECIES: HNH endonuclease [unclassified Microcoleus]MCC3532095.1 HNH endonuclease [Microcoleus sp. PH2017_21_RUC_O_A]MCC3544366.1 HNH endonuclease [Microcoleus sp. PH2017_22_RUC_O_B]